MVLGRDVRLSSSDPQAALSDGLRRGGRDEIDIGAGDTDEVYFQTVHLKLGRGTTKRLVREKAKEITLC